MICLNGCKGCLVTNNYGECGIKDNLKNICPCIECLVKMVCEKPCEEWSKVRYSTNYYHFDGQWKWIRK